MRLEKKHRHSIEKKNAPYRGVSSKEDFVNGSLEVLHDLNEIGIISEEEHRKEIQDRTRVLIAGETGEIRSYVGQVGKICTTSEIDFQEDLSLWTKVGNAQVLKNAQGFVVSEQGLLDPAGIKYAMDVEAGDIYLVSMKVRPVSGKVDEIKFGASRINLGNQELEKMDLTGKSSGVYVDKRLYCQHREQIEITVLLHDLPNQLSAAAIEVSDFHIYKVQEEQITLKGLEVEAKIELDAMREHIKGL